MSFLSLGVIMALARVFCSIVIFFIRSVRYCSQKNEITRTNITLMYFFACTCKEIRIFGQFQSIYNHKLVLVNHDIGEFDEVT